MGYVDYEYYHSLYDDMAVSESDFKRLSWEVCRKLDIATTGIDNVKKLKVAFPTNEDDAEAVRRCVCKLIQVTAAIEQAEKQATSNRGYIERDDGTMTSKLVSSVSSGSESISYVTDSSASGITLIDKVLSDEKAQERLYRDTITEYLSGVTDANGVNLLFMGWYPYKREEK